MSDSGTDEVAVPDATPQPQGVVGWVRTIYGAVAWIVGVIDFFTC